MTASDATATIKKGNSEPSFDKTAQRILNLFFVLNSSPEPLTTEQIVLDSDLGYGSGNIDSDKRKFRRDRDKLLERGILIKEVRPAGAQETEESSWTIDREHTFAAGGLITADDADILLNAIDQTIAAGSSTFAAPLADIRSKIAYLTGRTTADPPLSHRRCGMERLCRAMRAAIFISERTRRAERAYRLRLRHVRARGRGVLLRPRQCHRRHQDIPLRPYRSRLASFESLRHPCGLQSQRLSVL